MNGLTITLTTDPVLLSGSGIHGIIEVTVRNRGTGTAYLGSSGVAATTAAGYAMTSADTPLKITLWTGESLYGTSTGASVLDVLRTHDT